jgi:hypothetical protein
MACKRSPVRARLAPTKEPAHRAGFRYLGLSEYLDVPGVFRDLAGCRAGPPLSVALRRPWPLMWDRNFPGRAILTSRLPCDAQFAGRGGLLEAERPFAEWKSGGLSAPTEWAVQRPGRQNSPRLWEHMFVPKGSARAHFQRAIERKHLLSAETAARGLPKPVTLADALSLLLLIAEQDPPRYGRAAARWHGRFVLEHNVGLEDAILALVALASIRSSSAAIEVLAELGTRYRVANIEGALRRFRPAQFPR